MSPPPPASSVVRPKVLYYGTPVILVTTRNQDGGTNISPMSSSWALGDRVVLGMAETGHGLANLRRERECVINVPSPRQQAQVERLAPTTGAPDVPAFKRALGYRFDPDKFATGDLTPAAAELVAPPRIAECPLQLEARVAAIHESSPPHAAIGAPSFAIIETCVVRVHAHEEIVVPGTDRIDVSRWSPLLYVFRHYFGVGAELGRTFKADR